MAIKGTISNRLVHEALLGYARPGMDAAALLQREGLSAACLEDPEGRVSVAYFERMWRRLARRFDDEFFGMSPRPMRSGSFAFLCRACMAQSSLAEALPQGLEFLRLMSDDFRAELRRREDLAELVLRDEGEPRRAFAYFTFWLILHGLACWLSGRRIPILAVDLRCAEPAYLDDYRVMFSENLRFGRPRSRIIFAADALDLPIRRSEEDLRRFLAQAPGNILVKYQDRDSLATRIKAHLRSLPSADWPDGERLAAAFHVSASTLRRRLAEAGQPYQRIKDGVREERAIGWLADPELSFAQIAERLGFADLSSFYKAFRKWTGSNPGRYRNLILGLPERGEAARPAVRP
ncbi:AraC family transcriptional regulator [Pseudomonas sp. RIT-PI-AD]|uniref:AraC family transcriptional regulator n=1 Tax=Pseudomonas sp. RIT-PI-AD TaxID=3035294 RepID=UPI0021D92505|nr:AraC family transcriptional regulator [Pseudomonas sp. RIT-PI-AD]